MSADDQMIEAIAVYTLTCVTSGLPDDDTGKPLAQEALFGADGET